MAGKIKVLDDHLINKIAAGEVVDRPSSVVKELVENSLDAGSRKIEVEIRGGGIDYIRVTDDGWGVAEEEMALAFARHATSKLKTEEDLWCIRTMGFRGEALPSIGAVSKVIMHSNNGEGGASITVEGGKIVSIKAAAAPPGTTVVVQNLFYNTPARLKFLKSKTTEANWVFRVTSQLALAHPEVMFSLVNEGRLVFKTPGRGDLKETAGAVLGHSWTKRLLELHKEAGEMRIHGLIGDPSFTYRGNRGQFYFVNRRVVQNRILARALQDGYQGFLVGQERPVGMIFVDVPSEWIDVNVHPQKTEVRFKDEQKIYSLVRLAVREKLSSLNDKGTPYFEILSLEENREAYDAFSSPSKKDANNDDKWSWLDEFDFKKTEPPEELFSGEDKEKEESNFHLLGQWASSYIICEIENRLEIIDQHALHERIIFDELQTAPGNLKGEELLFPLSVQLPPELMEAALENMDLLSKLGYRVEIMGERSLAIRQGPAVAKNREIEVLLAVLEDIEKKREREGVETSALTVVACKSAVKAGERLTLEEMNWMLKKWFMVPRSWRCPHGRPVSVSLTMKEIEKWLKR